MKKGLFILFVLTLISLTSNAQNAGRWWLGGSISAITTSVDGGDNSTSFAFLPEAGYQLNDKWGIGVAVGYAELDQNNRLHKTFSVNPFARLSVFDGNFGDFFLEGGVKYAHRETENVSNSDVNTLNIGISPGFHLDLHKNISFMFKFGYIGWSTESRDGAGSSKLTDNSFGVSFNPMDVWELGLRFKL